MGKRKETRPADVLRAHRVGHGISGACPRDDRPEMLSTCETSSPSSFSLVSLTCCEARNPSDWKGSTARQCRNQQGSRLQVSLIAKPVDSPNAGAGQTWHWLPSASPPLSLFALGQRSGIAVDTRQTTITRSPLLNLSFR